MKQAQNNAPKPQLPTGVQPKQQAVAQPRLGNNLPFTPPAEAPMTTQQKMANNMVQRYEDQQAARAPKKFQRDETPYVPWQTAPMTQNGLPPAWMMNRGAPQGFVPNQAPPGFVPNQQPGQPMPQQAQPPIAR